MDACGHNGGDVKQELMMSRGMWKYAALKMGNLDGGCINVEGGMWSQE